MAPQLLENVTLVTPGRTSGDGVVEGHSVADVLIDGDHIVAVDGPGRVDPSAVGVDPARVERHDLDGWLLLAAPIEPHAHLDKAFLAERLPNPTGDLIGAIEAMKANRHLLDVDETAERAERAARLMARNGFVAVRSHIDATVDNAMLSIEALAPLKERVADVIDLEIVALCGWPVTGPDGAEQRALIRDVMAAGADLVGGAPHLETGASRAAIEWLCELATERGVGVDLHIDETLDPTSVGLVELCDVVDAGFANPATASHSVSLGMQPANRQAEIAERVAASEVSVVALPQTNLFLQGRGHAPMPRGLTAVGALRAAGATVAAGADNLQDPFNPVGRACPFETAGLMVMTSHLLPHEAWEMVSTEAARATGRTPAPVAVGSVADLLAVPARCVREAIASAPPQRRVWRRGAETNTLGAR